MPDVSNALKEVWDKALLDLKAQVSDQTFTAWFDPIQPISLNETTVTLAVPNNFFKDWVSERYLPLIKSSFSGIIGKNISVVFSVTSMPEITEKKDVVPPPAPVKEKKNIFQTFFPKHTATVQVQQIGLNAKYTFDTFVIGPSNLPMPRVTL